MSSNQTSRNISDNTALRVIGASFVLFALLLTAAFVIPIAIPDGTEHLPDKEKRAASHAINDLYDLDSSMSNPLPNIFPALKYRVTELQRRSTPAAGMWKDCEYFYEVFVERITYFGFRKPQSRLDCGTR